MPDSDQLIANERVKYAAAAVDRLSTACYAIGCLGPTAKLFLEAIDRPMALPTVNWAFWAANLTFLLAGVLLHRRGEQLLGGLR